MRYAWNDKNAVRRRLARVAYHRVMIVKKGKSTGSLGLELGSTCLIKIRIESTCHIKIRIGSARFTRNIDLVVHAS